MSEQDSKVRKVAPAIDDDLYWWFFQRDAEIGQASIHEVQVAMALRGARNSGGSDNKANKLITKGVVRTNSEQDCGRLGVKLEGRTPTFEGTTEKLTRISRCWEQITLAQREILRLAYGHKLRTRVEGTARVRREYGDELIESLGPWPEIVPLTRTMIEAHAHARPTRRVKAQRIDRDSAWAQTAVPDVEDAPAWLCAGWAGLLYRRAQGSGPPTEAMRALRGDIAALDRRRRDLKALVTERESTDSQTDAVDDEIATVKRMACELRALRAEWQTLAKKSRPALHRVCEVTKSKAGDVVVVLATTDRDPVRVYLSDFVEKWVPGDAGERMPPSLQSEHFHPAAPDLKSVREWLADLTSDHPPKGAKALLDAARKESERIVFEAWTAWSAVRDPGRPRRTPRTYTRKLAQPFGGAEVE
jgi:hypothetical protein